MNTSIDTPAAPVQLTLLSTIPGADFRVALARQKALDLKFLDLKDGLWGRNIEQLDEAQAERAAALIGEFDLQTHCFSTSIGHCALEPNVGESEFRARFEPPLQNALRAARVMRPRVVRLLAPRLPASKSGECAVARLLREFSWCIGVYRDWIDEIFAAGFEVLIENEARGCCLASVSDVRLWFEALDRPRARFIYDVQNLWQSGTFPTLAVYRELRPLVGAVHLKGGRGEHGQLRIAAPLDEASWPVLEIVREVVRDGAAPFICLNPSHGEKPPLYDVWEVARREIAWLRREIKEFA